MSYNLEESSALTAVFAVATAGAALTGLSSGATTYSFSIFAYSILGAAYKQAIASGAATPTTDGNSGLTMTQPVNTAAAYVWAVNAAGTVTVFQGPTSPWHTGDAANSVACQLPFIPASFAAFAIHTIQNGVTAAFAMGTTNWNATNVVVGTVINLCQMKNTPILTT